ncbi:MAG: YqgE/AlgH family protein [Pseudomonas oryzihabitans]
MKPTSSTTLQHQLLIAMPQMDDPNFAETVIYLVDHGPDGAMGLVINRPNGLHLDDLLEQLRPEVPATLKDAQIALFSGGPVQNDRGFVLHAAGLLFQNTLELEELSLTTSPDVLFAISDGTGPDRHLITLGYSGWGPGQLEEELAANLWLTTPATSTLLFDTPTEQRLGAAAALLGIDLRLLSRQAGHA